MQIKTSGKKTIVKLSKKEWLQIGEQSGWIKEAQESSVNSKLERLVEKKLRTTPEEEQARIRRILEISLPKIKLIMSESDGIGTLESKNVKKLQKKASNFSLDLILNDLKSLIDLNGISSEQVNSIYSVISPYIKDYDFTENGLYALLGGALMAAYQEYKKRRTKQNEDKNILDSIKTREPGAPGNTEMGVNETLYPSK